MGNIKIHVNNGNDGDESGENSEPREMDDRDPSEEFRETPEDAPEGPRIVLPSEEEIHQFVSEGGNSEEIRESQAELTEKAAKADEYLDHLKRLQAEFDNYRKRTDRERAESSRLAIGSLISDLLEVLDVFERALHPELSSEVPRAYREGIEMVHGRLREILRRQGLERIEAVGQPFDPKLHEALVHEETDEYPPGFVSGEFHAGYLLKESLLRPAGVKVAKEPSTQSE